jgi:hypothetical protein
VTNTSSWYSVDKTIRGLYGSYFLSCTQNGNRTSGNGGAISNG